MSSKESSLRVENVSKVYHLWRSPRERLFYGLWNQMPSWAPGSWQAVAQKKRQALSREFRALNGVSFDVRPGEVLGVLGRNGSGKSTLLQIIAKTLAPTTGHVSVSGRITALLELGSGFNPEFSGRENVFLNALILGFPREETQRRFDEIVQFSELGDFIDQPVKTYSSGMAVRLAFAVQVLLDPQILIVDEALAVGDIFFQQKCFQHMRNLVKKNVSILLATHDFGSVHQFCDRALVLDEGNLAFIGSADEAVRKFYFLAGADTMSRTVAPRPGSSPERTARAQRTSGALYSPPVRPLEWPSALSFIDLLPGNHDFVAGARCLRFCILDRDNRPATVFEQGQTAKLFAEFLVLEDFSAVSTSFSIKDPKGQLVHGKHALQSLALKALPLGEKGGRIRMAAEVALELDPSQYTINFGALGIEMPRADLVNHRALPVEALNAASRRICTTKPVGLIQVGLRQSYSGFQLSHFGLVNLPSQVECQPVGGGLEEGAAPGLDQVANVLAKPH